jgi:hypothetical protein
MRVSSLVTASFLVLRLAAASSSRHDGDGGSTLTSISRISIAFRAAAARRRRRRRERGARGQQDNAQHVAVVKPADRTCVLARAVLIRMNESIE